MIDELVKAWDKNKSNLEDYFKTTRQCEYDKYGELVKILFEKVINPYFEELTRDDDFEYHYFKIRKSFDLKHITEIDNGDYQGTLIYIIPLNTYQPSVHEHLCVYVYYGSCSGCDTLLGISNYDTGLPTEEQVREYMLLCLHMIQDAFWLKERGE